MNIIYNSDYVTFNLYGKFDITISTSNWEYMCHNRWFNENPEQEVVEAEFGICGARKARNTDEATKIVLDTIYMLRDISEHEDINDECREMLESAKVLYAHLDENGEIVVEAE